jgi:light-regulated signal transduction histidine kinase (bacteriophytochrome)
MTGKAAKSPKPKSPKNRQKPAPNPPAIDLPSAGLSPDNQQLGVELFTEISFKIRRSLELKEILRTIVTEVRQVLQADRVLIYQVLADGTGNTVRLSEYLLYF